MEDNKLRIIRGDGADKHLIIKGNIMLDSDFVEEAYYALNKIRKADYDAKMMVKCREACRLIREEYKDIRLKIHRYFCDIDMSTTWYIYHDFFNDDSIDELLGKIILELFYEDNVFNICMCESQDIENEEGEFYDE